MEDRFFGILVKGLLEECGAQIAAMDVAFASALFGDRRNAAGTLQVVGLGIVGTAGFEQRVNVTFFEWF